MKRKPPPPTAVLRFRNYRWSGVELEPYKLAAHRGGEFLGASRQVLIGKRGEQVGFHLRYFELEPGGFTSLERHHHSHVVIGVAGIGRVLSGDKSYTLRPLDTIYIGPDQPHQLIASSKERFGFFCVVNARRDKPRPAK